MAGKKLRRLTRLRVLLVILAVVLFAAVCFTGGMLCFINYSLAEDAGEPTTETTTEPEEPPSSEDTQPSEEEDSAPDLAVGKVGGEPTMPEAGVPESTAGSEPECQHVYDVQKVNKDTDKVRDANCSSPAVYRAICSLCGASGTVLIGDPNPDNHIFADGWSSNDAYHWHVATCSHNNLTSGMVNHDWGKEFLEELETEIVTKKACTICGYEKIISRQPVETTEEESEEKPGAKTEAKIPKPNRLSLPMHFALKAARKLNAVDATSVLAEDNPVGTEEAIVSQGATVSSDGSAAGKLIHFLGLDDENADLEAGRTLYVVLFLGSLLLLAADVFGIVIVSGRIRRTRRRASMAAVPKTQSLKQGAAGFDFAKIHSQGARRYQQDSHGMTPVMNGEGVFAIVADGMGGLSGGEQVSQQIVMQALNFMADITPNQAQIALPEMLSRINGAVNKMLGPEGLYKSGSTVVAVLVVRDRLRWISVGDSRIYLYREGWMNQLTRDHDLFQEWMPDILAGKRSFAEAMADPDGRKLTSFIGMGELKYIDCCTSSIRILPGDRIVLMSDGVYNSVPADTVADILRKNPDVQKAAGMLHKAVRAAANPHQDNYTAEILAF